MLCFRRKNFWGPSQGNRNGGSGSSSLDSTLASSSPAPGQGKNGLKSGISKLASTMAPPPNVAPAVHPVMREVTEDTPPDLLEGTMDLLVVLPSKKTVRMTVNRRTPMMDLLIQAATANKIVPAGHIVQVRNERGIELPYKPSTPIGALDTTTIEIVPKNQVNEYIIVKKQTAKLANQPFEQTFRLQVHLPRNQLYVMRVSPKTLLEDILQEVCQEKNLDCTKYEMRHPVKLDEKLPLDRRLGDFGLQELTVVSRNSRINSSVSTADIMALQQEEGRSKGCLDSAFKHSRSSVGDSSVSSESAVSARGISPSRSDDSRSISPLPPVRPKLKLNTTMSNASSSSGTSSSVPKSQLPPSSSAPLKKSGLNSSVNNIAAVQAPPRPKKRAAPLPPGMVSHQSLPPPSSSSTPLVVKNNVNAPVTTTVPSTPLSNISNNSSTVVSPPIRPTPRKKEPPREPPITKATFLPIHHSRHSSDSSGYHEACEPHDNHHRFDRQQSVPSIQTLGTLPTHARVSSSVSVTNLTTVSSISTTSLASSNGGVRKRKAPRPPVPSLQAQKETEEELSASTPSLTTIVKGSESFGTREAPVRNNRKVVSNKSEPETSVEEVAAEEEPESPVQQITVTVPERKVERKLEKVEKVARTEEKAEEPLQSQPSLEETSLPPTPSQGSSLSSSTCSSTNNSSQGSTSSSPVPTPEGSCSTPTAAAPSSQESFEETPPETTTASNPTTAKMSSLSSPSPVVPVVEESTSASPSMGRPTSTNAQASLSSSTSSSSVAAAAPSVPARKPRTVKPSVRSSVPDSNLMNAGPEPSTPAAPVPKPKPRPRSTVLPPDSSLHSSMTDISAPASSRVDVSTTETSPPGKPVVSRMGIKVLPDNALEARLARLSKQESESASASPPLLHETVSVTTTPTLPRQDSKTVVTRKKARAPDPMLATTTATTKKPFTSASSLRNSNVEGPPSLVSAPETDPDDNVSLSSLSNDIPPQTAHQREPPQTTPQRRRTLSQDSESGESDNLEENLELFELSPPRKTIVPEPSLIDLPSPSSRANHVTPIRKKRPAPVPHQPLVNDSSPRGRIKSDSSFLKGESLDGAATSPDDDDPQTDVFTRTASDRHLQRKTNLYVKHRNKDASKKPSDNASQSHSHLNRWQNYESLDAIEKRDSQGSASSALNNSLTRKNPLPSTPPLGNGNTITASAGRKKKISVSSQELTTSDSDDDKVDVHDTHDDSALVSSESEASCTDSGIPQTETVTPSPVDRDLDRSEKDLSSETSSRRSSMHSMGGTETSTTEALREILQAKIESEQEIIDKAFEGIDADILDMEEEENEEMEEEMRKKSNNFDLIKPPNMSNLLESNTSSPHPATDHTSDDERDAFSLSSHDDEEEKELKFSVENEPIEKLDKSDPRLQNESESMVKAVVVQRKLPKSESFSHNSEFDVVKMKRRVFSKEGKVSAVVKKSYDCSSSDEEDQPENKKALPPNSKGRAGSMQNLSNLGSSANNSSGGVSSSSGSIQTRMGSNQLDSRVPGNVNNRRNSPPQSQGNKEVRKATSVLNIQDLDPDISQNPQLMASFQNELEAQFEQWKEQFLQRHLGGSKATSFDNASNRSSLSDALDQVKPSTPINQTSVDETESVQSELTRNNSREHTVIQTTAEVHSVRTDQVINTQEKEEEEEPPQETEPVLKEVAAVVPVRESTEAEVEVREAEEAAQEPATVEEQQVSESFDPEKPQIIHSVSSTVSQQQPSVTSHLDNNNVSSSSDNKALAQVDASVTLKPTEEIDIVKTEEETTTAMPVITTDKSVKKPEEEQKVYKYSGPPTIQMGTWGERPSRSVSVKKDTDYIMGMGQQNPQLEKLSVGSVAARISSYVSSQPPPQKNTSTLTRSTTVNSNGAPRPKSIAVIHTGSIDLPSSPASTASTAPVSKVVSSWQQRLEQNKQSEQNERKSVLPNGSNSLEAPVTTTVIETEAKTLVHSESSSTTSTLERPKKLPAMAMFENNSNSSTLPPSLKYGERRSFGYNANNSKSVDEIDSASDYSSSSSRPNSSLSRAPSNASTSNITIGSMSDSTSSSPVPPVSLSEKKKFFQGIKPVDSGKDAPIPAQNLKGNIATIQRVFEARQKFNAGIAQKESSPTLIINSSNNNNNNNNNISSTQMVQKVMKAGSFNVDSFRRTPSPAQKVELVQQQQQQPQQHKPQFQQQKTEAPQTIKITNTNRISVSAFEKPVEVKEETIKNVGNKSIIIVGSEDKIDSSPNNIFRQKLKVTAPNPPTTVSIQTGAHPQEKVNFRMNDERSIEITNKPSNVLKRAPSTPLITTATAQNSVEIPVSAGKVSSIAASLKSSNNGFFNSLQRPAKSASSSVNSLHGSTSTLNKSSNDKPIIIKEVEKARKVSVEKTPEAVNVSGGVNGNSQPHRNSNGAPIPPPPPINLMEGVKLRPAGLSNGMNGRPKSLNTSQSLPPASKGLNSPNGDPRSEIFDAIKNSNGKFALKKTGSTILLN